MRHHKTVFNGLEPNDDLKVTPFGNTEIIRLSDQDTLAYGPLVAHIGGAFARAYLNYEETKYTGPTVFTVVVSETAESRYKPDDNDTRLERVLWFIENSMPPPGGVVAQVYINEHMNRHLDTPFGFNTLWRTKDIWSKKTAGSYILLQPHSEIDHNVNRGGSAHRHSGLHEQIDMVRELAAKYNIMIREVDYTTSIDELYDLMLGCKMHIGYVGATHYVAAYTGTPTVCLGKELRNPKFPVFAYRHPSASFSPTSEELKDWIGVWNALGTPSGRTLMYSNDHNTMHQDEPRYYRMANPLDMHHTKMVLLDAFMESFV